MRQYIYKPSDAGLSDWPSGTLRLEGIEVTEDPTQADVFVCPGVIRIFESSSGVLDMARLNALPHFKGNESRHAFFDVSDNFSKPINLPIMFIRCDVRDWMLPHDPNTIQMAWPAPNCEESIPLPDGGFKFDVSFQGWNWSETRKAATAACRSSASLKCDFSLYADFFGYLKDQAEIDRRTQEFRRSLRESRLILCPESIPGVFPYRFFEALSAARVPLLVGSDFVYPFADEIDWKSFVVWCSRSYADQAHEVAESFLAATSDDYLVEMGLRARAAWEKYLDSRHWPRIMAHAVEKHLQARLEACRS